MRIAILSYSLHTGCITTSLKKSLRHNKTDCIITFFFFPLQGAFLLLFTPPPKRSMYCWSTLWWEQKKKKGEKRKESGAGMWGKRRHSQYPFLPRHPSEKEQRDKRSRWMEMELMVKESVTGSNKSKREWAAVNDRKIWTKTGHELEADMEGGEGRWKLCTRRSDWGQEAWTLTKGQTNGRLVTTSLCSGAVPSLIWR